MTTQAARRIELSSPIDLRRTLLGFRRGPGDPTHRQDGQDIWRTTWVGDGPVTMRLRQADARSIEAQAWGRGADLLLEELPGWFPALDFEPPADAHPHVADAQRRFPGMRVPATGRVMEALIPAVLEQKVLGADAFAAFRRLVTRFGHRAPGPTPLPMWVVPTAGEWAALPSWEWHLAGVDPARYRAAQAVARLGDRFDQMARGPRDQLYRALRSVPGIGAWTVAEVGVRALGDADAVSWGDYHLAHLVGMGLLGRRATDEEVPALLEPYRPHRAHVVRLLTLSPHVRMERRGPRNSRVDHRRI